MLFLWLGLALKLEAGGAIPFLGGLDFVYLPQNFLAILTSFIKLLVDE